VLWRFLQVVSQQSNVGGGLFTYETPIVGHAELFQESFGHKYVVYLQYKILRFLLFSPNVLCLEMLKKM